MKDPINGAIALMVLCFFTGILIGAFGVLTLGLDSSAAEEKRTEHECAIACIPAKVVSANAVSNWCVCEDQWGKRRLGRTD